MTGNTFQYYLAGHFFKNLVYTFLLFLSLIIAVDMIELSRDISAIEGAGIGSALAIAAFRAPAFAENILPFATLFGAAGSLILLNRRLELVVARASGVSVWQFLGPLIFTAALTGICASLIYNPVSLWAKSASRSAEASVFGQTKGTAASSEGNFWLRAGQSSGDVVVRARVAQGSGTVLTAVSVYRFDADDQSIERLDAARAEFEEVSSDKGQYILKNVRATVPGEGTVDEDERVLPLNISKSQLQARATRANETGFWELGKQAERAVQAGRSPLPFITQRHALLAQPLLFAAMVLIAATFSLRFARFGQSGKAILGGIMAGFVLYVATRLVLTFGSNGLVPPPIAAWTPSLVATLIGTTVLLHQEDG